MKYVIVKILKSLLYTVNMRSGTIKERIIRLKQINKKKLTRDYREKRY